MLFSVDGYIVKQESFRKNGGNWTTYDVGDGKSVAKGEKKAENTAMF